MYLYMVISTTFIAITIVREEDVSHSFSIHQTTYSPYNQLIVCLLLLGSLLESCNRMGSGSSSALPSMIQAAQGDIDLVTTLFRQGADVNEGDAASHTPLRLPMEAIRM